MSAARTCDADARRAELEAVFRGERVVVVGVGRRGCGDDGFGPAVVDALAARGVSVPLVDAGPCPENMTAVIARHEPTGVLWLDAGSIGQPPGTWMLCEPEALAGTGVCTHTGSLALLARYLAARTGARNWFLLAQPVCLGDPAGDAEAVADPPPLTESHPPADRLSAPMAATVRQVSRLIADACGRGQNTGALPNRHQ